jgi:hypothetical protein
MKAVEYAERFKKTFQYDEVQAVSDLMIGLFKEGKELIDKRHAEKDSAIISILREQNLKYKACCNVINKDKSILRIDGYEWWIKNKMGIEI